jgi:hypothetical protein
MKMSLFEKATRTKVRFDTFVGSLSVEDLWDLPLISNSVNLDVIAIELNKALNNCETESFVKEENPNTKHLKFKLDVVKHIIEVKVEEAAHNEKRKAWDSRRQELLELKTQKRLEMDQGKTMEELDEELAKIPQ